MVFVSKKAFDALDPATRKVVLDAAAAAETRGWKVSEEKPPGMSISSRRTA